MRIQTEEWRRFIPGVRMYKGKKTLFYNGEKLSENIIIGRCPLIYDYKEQQSWEVIIVLPGVKVIPSCNFEYLANVKMVIIADNSVKRIEFDAFRFCKNLAFVKLSRNLEYIGERAFQYCESLTSMFIPPSCREISSWVFHFTKLIILVVPPHTELGIEVFFCTPLWRKRIGDENAWVKSINDNDLYRLYRLCSSMDPSEDEIYQMICEQGGLHALVQKNSVGITPSEYLAANPYADVDEMKLVKRILLENMGEIV
ncbi:hypothetical protein CTEN210_18056 [Chaetoceros tenuissimus]|uniref:Leucine-rich repeat domain-containing protein n=1 Tax=Chaetoceros tenuissimus TaxID=426638 RepID=A0AAD3HFC5_9STRA|nr:hypothetical protein CTEN210_18056 [Chaetoceros tenuissimus]